MISRTPHPPPQSRSDQWAFGQSLRHTVALVACRHAHHSAAAALARDPELAQRPLPAVPATDHPVAGVADPGGARRGRTGSPAQRAREQVGARMWLRFSASFGPAERWAAGCELLVRMTDTTSAKTGSDE